MDNAIVFLLEQSKERENQAVLALSQARAELEDYYQQLKQIENYRLDYCDQLVEKGKELGIDVDQRQLKSNYIVG